MPENQKVDDHIMTNKNIQKEELFPLRWTKHKHVLWNSNTSQVAPQIL